LSLTHHQLNLAIMLLRAHWPIRIGKLRNFVLEKFNEIAGSPYQCETLQELNKTAAELVTQLNIPMPPMINNLMGVRFRLDTIDLSGDIPKGDGMLAITRGQTRNVCWNGEYDGARFRHTGPGQSI